MRGGLDSVSRRGNKEDTVPHIVREATSRHNYFLPGISERWRKKIYIYFYTERVFNLCKLNHGKTIFFGGKFIQLDQIKICAL